MGGEVTEGGLVSLGLVLMVVVEVTNAATPATTPESMHSLPSRRSASGRDAADLLAGVRHG